MGESKRRQATADTLFKQAQQMHAANRLAEAKTLYRQALQLAPSKAEAWMGLGMLARQVGQRDAALQALGHAVELAPAQAAYRFAWAQAMREKGMLEQAVEQFRMVCDSTPGFGPSWFALGVTLQTLGERDAALEAYRRASAIGDNPVARLALATCFSPVLDSVPKLQAERADAEAALDALLASPPPPLDPSEHEQMWPNFYLAFHGLNNRSLQAKYAELYRRVFPALRYTAPHCQAPAPDSGRIRVGLISNYFFNHSIGRTSRGLFAQLARDAFETVAIFIAPGIEDDYSRFIREHAERTLMVPRDLVRAQQLIAEQKLDILFYQDIGMEPFTYLLAFSRLAPVQCVSFGHPDTTGIPAMDYWVSNDLYERPEAAEHYSERLFLLRGLGSLAYYYKPELPQPPKQRRDFGLNEDDRLYICPQNLFKFHPDMDELIGGILRRDPRGKLVLIEARVAHWNELLRTRWLRVLPDVADRIVFLPRLGTPDYVNLIAVSDVMLDTIHFNGMNTSLEALSVGTPIVTLPGEFQRGRHTQAMLRRIGVGECIAENPAHYVELAVRLANDPGLREPVRAAIRERAGALFEDREVVREFERFFREAVAANRAAQ